MDTNNSGKLGAQIRAKRKQLGISMTALAKDTGFSQSYLSQVERGLIHPSIGALQKIAQALNESISFFFDEQLPQEKPKKGKKTITLSAEPDVAIVRADKRKGLIQPGSTVKYELLSPNLQGALEMLYIVAHPGGGSGPEYFVHDGHEGGVVLSGILEYEIDGQVYRLNPGDSIHFKSVLPHRWKNVGDQELRMFWVTTPPSF